MPTSQNRIAPSLNQFASRNDARGLANAALTQFAIVLTANGFVDEYLQYRALEQLTTDELQQLLNAEVDNCEQLLDRPVDELTSQDWKRLRGYESHLELVAA
ncbi:hypothetical protein NIES4072_65190 [Nostoc commune NIES-4072]|uniref:Uncharacterized protein n=1 Tax=Nostoc commune NIES-4072 TaxID=2005467 RepID=A0A2R5FVN9_NOSCO|nr:hypothetical protein [Nostoc commune]BBD70154.1 hypothetical protein NIES4070_65650 [Nostoc commune HK-02]GBG22807.1 hypothetical protein NIES4072_65190 [Nostoc commune NIES-4072]